MDVRSGCFSQLASNRHTVCLTRPRETHMELGQCVQVSSKLGSCAVVQGSDSWACSWQDCSCIKDCLSQISHLQAEDGLLSPQIKLVGLIGCSEARVMCAFVMEIMQTLWVKKQENHQITSAWGYSPCTTICLWKGGGHLHWKIASPICCANLLKGWYFEEFVGGKIWLGSRVLQLWAAVLWLNQDKHSRGLQSGVVSLCLCLCTTPSSSRLCK